MLSELKKIRLHDLHLEMGAKMVAFSGYQMPVQYAPGIIKEHLHCRNQAGFFDISHMGQCLITGEHVEKELEKISPGNITGLKPGQQRYTVLTNDKGGIIDDIIINRTEYGFLIIVNAACKEKDFAHIRQSLSEQCTFSILQDQALFALQGPAAAQVIAELYPPAASLAFMQGTTTHFENRLCFINRCGYTGEDGFEISIENDYAETLAKRLLSFDQVLPIGLGARDTLRLEAGLSLYGNELSDTISPVEAGLKWTIRKNATGFPGAELIRHQLDQGTSIKKVGLKIEGKIALRKNSELFDNQDNLLGNVTSGSFSPSLGAPIALALINSNYKESMLYAKVRNHKVAAQITKLPFISHRYHKS